ncbi:unnamed protein product [Adineta steineri]|uniref:Xaa-Pro dipeptidyl-peptidase C-terminal domain-containing protein n=1 Tax=Adineta steineri TaxID=433720 RepID=A0A815KRV9_9BILA|nr:unnamed protein product [Adineta steineri]CAF1611907.1 unnamed protein product [Adineta steineri]
MSSAGRSCVYKWSSQTNITTTVAGRENYQGTTSEYLSSPEGIYVDGNSGTVYIADYVNNRIQKWEKDAHNGTTVAGLSTGEGGSDHESLSEPSSVWVDDETHVVYVADSANERIQRSLYNALVGDTIAGGSGTGDKLTQFDQPIDLKFDNDGNLYVCDRVNHRVLMFKLINNEPCFPVSTPTPSSTPTSTTTSTENVWLSMPDGVRLSTTLTIPVAKHGNEKFPVLLEYKPYRKDDNSFNADQSNIFYLARRGFTVAKVDIRGTGSSEGVLIEREYTTQELDDCEHVIKQLADYSHSNGRVGMFGLSWSAFNSLMMATLRRPPALRTIFAAHASDDLYKNDIHYPDGIMHLDHYIVSIDHANALPATPNYVMNEQWIKERFTRRPWADIYLEHQLDDSFWRKHSIKYAYANLTLPTYLIGGLYDPYKDTAINIYEHAHQISPKIKVVVGPFVHTMPDNVNRNPGPGFDSNAEMVRWFNHWLKDDNGNSDILNEPDITLFIRTSLTTGTYRYEPQWPIPRQRTRRMYMTNDQMLTEQIPASVEGKRNNSNVDTLEYRPWIGFESGLWLGGLTGHQQSYDEHSLVYQSDPINEIIEIIGFVNVSLQVSATAPMAHWIVRLEDVDNNGQVWLVTTGALNGAQRQTPSAPLEPNHTYIITFRLHFTTWTFFTGHSIRVATSNAMFPTYWPSAFAMNTSLFLNSSATFIDLPVILPLSSISPPPSFTQQQVSSTDIFPELFSAVIYSCRLYWHGTSVVHI